MRSSAAVLVCAALLCVTCPPAAAQRGPQRVDILVQRYMDQRDALKYDEALQTMLKARDLTPQDWDVWGFLGEAYFNKEMWADAIQAFRRALELGSTSDFDREKLAQALTYEGWARHENGNDADAERLLLEAIQHDPANADAHNNLAIVLQEQQRYQEARREYDRAIELAPEWSWARNNLGTLFQDLGELDQAAEKYREAIRLDPDYLEARTNLIWVLIPLGEFEEAERECRIVLDKGGDAATTYSNLGRALAGQGRFEEAERAYNDAKAADPEHWAGVVELEGLAGAMVRYSHGLAGAGSLEEAISLCRRAHERDPHDEDALTWLAAYLWLQKPAGDPGLLEIEAAKLVTEGASHAVAALSHMVRAGRLADGTLLAASLLRGEQNLWELGRWRDFGEDTGGSDECAIGLAFMAAFGRADALVVGLQCGPDALAGAEYLLKNDRGASVALDVDATRWLDGGEGEEAWVPDILCFPLRDDRGADLLAAEASELVLTVKTTRQGSASLSWPLPVAESRLGRQAAAQMTPAESQRLRFFAAQAVFDYMRRAFVMRWTPEMLQSFASEDERAELGRIGQAYVVAMLRVQGVSADDLLRRVCLVGSDRSRRFGVPMDDLLPSKQPPPVETAVEAEEAPPAPEEAPEEEYTEGPVFVAFPLLTEDGRKVLTDDDGTVRIALLGLDGETVQALWEFPRRAQDVPMDQ